MGQRVYAVAANGTIHVPDQPEQRGEALRQLLEHYIGLVMEELLRLEAADASIDLEFSSATIRMSVSVRAGNPVEATNLASGLFRAAIHAAGGMTPDWPSVDDATWTVELTRVESGQLVAS